jgi:nitrate reductase (NAD(P)H)
MVDPDEAAKNKEWWKDERYAIYDLSPNSATACPAHDEKLELTAAPEHYTVRGYAYSGGGRRITRVQVSIDSGKHWQLANIDYAEDKYRTLEDKQLFGGRLDMDWRETSFCWCFWDLSIPVAELKDAKDIIVRSMDESMNIQPRDMYWSVLGMMNNPWFRIVVHKEGDTLRFEHPTQPALMSGGWMERTKKAGGNLTNGHWGEKIDGVEADVVETEAPIEIKMTKDDVKREISIGELRAHDQAKDPWFVVNGEVYDGTAFLEGHPGGAQSIISAAGADTSEEFMAIRQSSILPIHKTALTASRQRNSQSNDARLPHRNPRPKVSNLPNVRRIHLFLHRTTRRIPIAQNLGQSYPRLQNYRIMGHPNLPLPARARRAIPRPAYRPTPNDPPQRPRNPRIDNPILHAYIRNEHQGPLRRPGQNICRRR